MKCVAFDRDAIDIHFQKMAKMFFALDGEASLKQAFVSSLPKMLASQTMTIVEEKFQSITIPPIGYIRQAIFLALDDICTKRSVLKQIIRNNPALDKACEKSDLITWSSYSCHVPRRKGRFKRFKWPRPSREGSQFRRRMKYFRRKSPEDYTGIHLDEDGDLESVLSLEEEPTEKTLFSIDVYEEYGDEYYEISEPEGKAQEDINGIMIKEIEKQLVEHSCADSHKEFMGKCKKPLWLNEEFFIKLPFKKNETINPTKASHSGMNPDHLQLAKRECEELLEFGLIEPSNSQWACEAFYVNKRAEQTRAKVFMLHRPIKIIDGKVYSQTDISLWWEFPVSVLSLEDEYNE
ncbi:uncharacterized protein LOC132637517 [Lycium barbarum]|uniref:uncharacterized protein LOC132637517 n=1 Tax=Lycium barbarum TaxID=112863 RepID=UPI00293F074F|nr:uncharacterized protein LOC132637517 [Lycium barbarum]